MSFPQPIFVGGSAASGTHAMGELIGADPRYRMIETEARFHCAPGGVCDVIEGRAGVAVLRRRTLGKWWKRGGEGDKGLQRLVERSTLEAALDRFESELADEPWEAGRRLIGAVLDPVAERDGKPAWVDISGNNIRVAPALLRLFPTARLVHTYRDGRAVAASIVHKRNMTDDPKAALAHWGHRMRVTGATLAAVPPDAVLTVPLDDLTAHRREEVFRSLVEFLEIDDEGPMREHFERHVSAERAHVGAWRERLEPGVADWVEAAHAELVAELRAEGIAWVAEPS